MHAGVMCLHVSMTWTRAAQPEHCGVQPEMGVACASRMQVLAADQRDIEKPNHWRECADPFFSGQFDGC